MALAVKRDAVGREVRRSVASGWVDERRHGGWAAVAAEERGRWDDDRARGTGGWAAPEADPDGRLHGVGATSSDPDGMLVRAVDDIAAVVATASPGQFLGTERLRERMQVFDRLAGLAAAGSAATLGALRTAGGVEQDGAGSTTEWLKANTRRSGREAARLARLSTELPDLPATGAALADGSLTPEGADAVVSAVRDGRLGGAREVEQELLATATTSSPERLRSEIRRRQQRADAAAMLRGERECHARRRARLVRHDHGGWTLHAEVTDEVGSKMRTALEAFDHAEPAGTADADRRPQQRMADALAAMVDAVLDRGLAPGTGGVVRPHLSVLVDLETLSGDLESPPGNAGGADTMAGRAGGADAMAGPTTDDSRWARLNPGELPWGGQLSPQAVRRLACDATITRIVMSGPSQVLDVGRATRNWSEPQRRAVNARDRQCRGPNCSRPIAWTAVHHVRWWERDRGPTDLDNGLALCHHCHHLVHDRGWTVVLDPRTARATWTSPAGRTTTTDPPQSLPPPRGSDVGSAPRR